MEDHAADNKDEWDLPSNYSRHCVHAAEAAVAAAAKLRLARSLEQAAHGHAHSPAVDSATEVSLYPRAQVYALQTSCQRQKPLPQNQETATKALAERLAAPAATTGVTLLYHEASSSAGCPPPLESLQSHMQLLPTPHQPPQPPLMPTLSAPEAGYGANDQAVRKAQDVMGCRAAELSARSDAPAVDPSPQVPSMSAATEAHATVVPPSPTPHAPDRSHLPNSARLPSISLPLYSFPSEASNSSLATGADGGGGNADGESKGPVATAAAAAAPWYVLDGHGEREAESGNTDGHLSRQPTWGCPHASTVISALLPAPGQASVPLPPRVLHMGGEDVQPAAAAPAAAASGHAVARYGTLLVSSAGWRCTELYDMRETLGPSGLASGPAGTSAAAAAATSAGSGPPRRSARSLPDFLALLPPGTDSSEDTRLRTPFPPPARPAALPRRSVGAPAGLAPGAAFASPSLLPRLRVPQEPRMASDRLPSSISGALMSLACDDINNTPPSLSSPLQPYSLSPSPLPHAVSSGPKAGGILSQVQAGDLASVSRSSAFGRGGPASPLIRLQRANDASGTDGADGSGVSGDAGGAGGGGGSGFRLLSSRAFLTAALQQEQEQQRQRQAMDSEGSGWESTLQCLRRQVVSDQPSGAPGKKGRDGRPLNSGGGIGGGAGGRGGSQGSSGGLRGLSSSLLRLISSTGRRTDDAALTREASEPELRPTGQRALASPVPRPRAAAATRGRAHRLSLDDSPRHRAYGGGAGGGGGGAGGGGDGGGGGGAGEVRHAPQRRATAAALQLLRGGVNARTFHGAASSSSQGSCVSVPARSFGSNYSRRLAAADVGPVAEPDPEAGDAESTGGQASRNDTSAAMPATAWTQLGGVGAGAALPLMPSPPPPPQPRPVQPPSRLALPSANPDAAVVLATESGAASSCIADGTDEAGSPRTHGTCGLRDVTLGFRFGHVDACASAVMSRNRSGGSRGSRSRGGGGDGQGPDGSLASGGHGDGGGAGGDERRGGGGGGGKLSLRGLLRALIGKAIKRAGSS